MRCVGDFTRSSVNLAVSHRISEATHGGCARGALHSTFDLKDAFRQCGAASVSTPHSHIVVSGVPA